MKRKEERRIVVLSKGVEKDSVSAGACCWVFYIMFRSAPEE